MRTVLLVVLIMTVAGVSWAECDRCDDSHLVCVGDSIDVFMSQCGPLIRTMEVTTRYGGSSAEIYVYSPEPGTYKYVRVSTQTQKVTGISTGM
jgi:hypothetical protein